MKKIIITIFTVLLMGSGVAQAAIYNIGPGDDFGNLTLVGRCPDRSWRFVGYSLYS